jgi:glycine/D-amino acid oxidase-like deaminating enzyme
MRHTRYGFWLEEAGSVERTQPLTGETNADVVIVGGGYLGLWTAWQLKQLDPEADVVVLEAGLAGHGPSGRNGGFVSTLWDDLPILRDRVGGAKALDVCHASERAVRGIGEWCEANGVDAWYRQGGTLHVATSEAQVGYWDDVVEACAELGVTDVVVPLSAQEVAERCASPAFLGGMQLNLAANVQPARLSLGLRARVMEAGVRLFENSSVRKLSRNAVATTASGTVRARDAVLAVNSATVGFAGYRLAHAVASSHMVITEPVPDVIDEIGWTGGENIHDCRTLLHYFRTTKDGRIAFGWGGGRMARGAAHDPRLDVDTDAVVRIAATLRRFFPQLQSREITHAWGGPIDVSPTSLPIYRSSGALHAGWGFTGHGVGPCHLGGRILSGLALGVRDEVTTLPLVAPLPRHFPPEPARFIGGSLIREALMRKDEREERGEPVGAVAGAAAKLPKLLGMNLPR